MRIQATVEIADPLSLLWQANVRRSGRFPFLASVPLTDDLTVLGDANDSLDAGPGWTPDDHSNGLQVFTQDVGGTLATLLVEPDVQTNADLVA
jgi:hypothetical protein